LLPKPQNPKSVVRKLIYEFYKTMKRSNCNIFRILFIATVTFATL